MEVELKLSLAAQDADTLRQHPLLKLYSAHAPHQHTMSDTYFDTPDQLIRGCNAGLRVRRVDDDWIQTMKGGGSVEGGLHSRHEWESQIAGPQPDLDRLRDVVDQKSAWGRLLRSQAVADGLAPIFTTRLTRLVWDLRLPQGDLVECVLDQGDLECGERHVPISEIELELKSGDPAHLFDFALALQQDIPMQIGTLSKADRGYALYAPQPSTAVKATPVKLSKHMNIEQAFKAVIGNCMTQVVANEAGVAVAEAHDVESVHQMRVGLRRLRSALGLFRDVITLPEDLQGDIAWLGEQLGAARDWDVLAGSTVPQVIKAAPDEAGLALLRRAAEDRAQDQHQVAAAAVVSSRYTRLILSLARWLEGKGWRDAMTVPQRNRVKDPIGKFARAVMATNQRRLLKRGNKLRSATPEQRHRVRIAAKKTRYATEFFRSLYVGKLVRNYLGALSELQDELGRLNDVAVANGLVQQLLDGQADLDGGAGYMRGYLAGQAATDDKKIRKLWKQFCAIKRPG